jgi:hypothetical protein
VTLLDECIPEIDEKIDRFFVRPHKTTQMTQDILDSVIRLPKELGNRVLSYLRVCITDEMHEDIVHLAKCRFRLFDSVIIYNAAPLFNQILTMLYQKNMVKNALQHCRVKMSEQSRLDLDTRPNKYDSWIEKIYNDADFAVQGYGIWRALHNVVCMLKPSDRAEVMSQLNYRAMMIDAENNDWPPYDDEHIEDDGDL